MHSPKPTRFSSGTVLAWIFLIFFSIPKTSEAQTPMEGLTSQRLNFTSPIEEKKIPLPEGLYDENSAWRQHPEFGTLPYNAPCLDCYELIERRTESTRYFVKKGSDGQTFYEQTAYGPLHVKDEQGFWVSIDSRLKEAPGALLTAAHQIHPFRLSLQDGTCTSSNLQHRFTWNKELELRRTLNGQTQSLGIADLSNPQYGADGIIFREAWPGVDIMIYSLLSAVHTDFKFKTDPGAGEYVIIDHFEMNQGLRVQAPAGRFSDGITILGDNNEVYYSYERAFVFDSLHFKSNIQYLDYVWNDSGKELQIIFNRDQALQSGLQFPMTIDPLVVTNNTLPLASITGSGYNAFCFTGGCAYNLSVPSPANAVITDVLFSFNYIAQGACWMSDGATTFAFNGCTSPNTPGFFWFCNNPATGVCTGNNLSIFSDIQACIPGPSCGSVPLNFSMRFYRCWQAGAGCSNTCIGANSPWTITIQGQSVAVATLNASSTNICAGASTNLTATGNYGVPPYTVSWNPGGLSGSPVTVSPAVTTAYTATITDACGITSTQVININVTPSTNPGFTISPNPACEGEAVSISGLGAGPATSYDWLMPSSSSPATNNQQNVAGISYATAGTYNITLNYAQGACVFPLVNTITINPAPAAPTISSNSPVCAGDQILLDGPSIPGATYSWTGPNGFASALEDPVINNASAADAGAYQLIITLNGCPSPASTLNMVVNPLPALPVLGSNSPVCVGQSLNLNANTVAGAVYNWTGPNGFVSALEDPVLANASTNMTGNYQLTIALGTCISPVANINVVVNPAPVVNASNTGPYCPASAIQLNASGGTSYSWTGPAGFNSNLQNPVINNSTLANSGNYQVTVTDANGCTATATTSVTVNATLAIVASANTPLCAGDQLNLNGPAFAGATYSWSGPNGFNSNLQNPVLNNVSSNAAGNYTLNITDANGCTGTSNVNVVVNTLPAANAGNNSPVCEGGNVQLNGSGGTSYSWSGPAGFISNNQNPTLAAVSIGMSGVYTLTVSDANNCSATATTSVTVHPSPSGNASNTGPYCAGDAISLGVNTGNSWTWTGPAGYNSLLQNPAINNSTPAMSGVYSVTVSDANNCTASFNTTVTVNALPNAGAQNNGPYCEGSTINLSANGGNSYSWTGPAGYISAAQNPGITNAVLADAGTYSVTVTDANNCSSTASTNVVVNPLPVASASNNGPYCINNNIQLNASGGNTYSWTGPAGFNNNNQNPVIANAALIHSGNYTVTISDANGCTATANTQVQVNVTLPVVATYSGAACEGQSFTLDVTQVPAATYAWSGPNAYNSALQSPLVNNAQLNMAGLYQVTVSTPNGCTGSSSVNVNVLPAPVANANNNGPLCEGANLQLNASGGNTYSWIGPNAFNSNLQNPSINAVGINAAGAYQVTITGVNGCTASTGTQVVINPLPSITINGNTNVCEGGILNLLGSGGTQFTWTTPGGQTQNSNNLNLSPLGSQDAGNYILTVSDAIGCTNTQSIAVNVEPAPDASFISDLTTGCAPVCIQFNPLNPAPALAYEWRSDGQVFSTLQSPNNCFPQSGNFDISLSITGINGCISTASVNDYLQLEQKPVADFISDKNEAPDSDPVIIFTNTSTGGSIFNWDFDDGSTETGDVAEHRFPKEGEYCVILEASSLSGCVDSAVHCIKITPDFFVFIPNSFSPNGDAINDNFSIRGTGIEEFTLDIYDRWGSKVISLSEPGSTWDGSHGGRNAEQGVYIYYLRVKAASGKSREFTGDVTLIR
jgi:gliding motility-associated-like protein